MKALLLSTALAAGLALPVTAQTASSPFQTEAAGPSVSASDLIGARVYASEAAVEGDAVSGPQEGWNDLGEVNDIILGRDGSVDAVLVDIGGFLGVGERQVAVDMAALRFVQDDATDADDWFLVMQADRATLDAAPEWTAVPPAADTTGADTTGADTSADTTGTDTSADTSAATTGTDTSMSDSTDAATDGATDADATDQATATDDGTAAPVSDPAAPEDVATAPADTAPSGDAPATADVTEDTAADTTADTAVDPATGSTAPGELPEGYAEVAPDVLTADMLDGANVHDMAGSSIAEVSDLVLSDDGKATEVIVDVGGFLGIGARTVAIPMDRVTVAQNGEGSVRLYVDMTKDELQALPEVEI